MAFNQEIVGSIPITLINPFRLVVRTTRCGCVNPGSNPDLTACLKYQLKCVSGGEIVFEGLCSLLLMQKNLQYDYKSWQITLRDNKFKNVYTSHIFGFQNIT